MRSLLRFIRLAAPTLLFLLLEVVSLVLLSNNSDYHQSKLMSSANGVYAKVYSIRHKLGGYMHLKDVNDELMLRNGQLEAEVQSLRQTLLHERWNGLVDTCSYSFLSANVLRNSVDGLENCVILDVGTSEGVQAGMGVVSPSGIAGKIISSSDHYSLMASVLNVKMRFSCLIKGTDVTGILSWNGKDIHKAIMTELPDQVMWEAGDTIVTSGFSKTFAPGIPIGVIESFTQESDLRFYEATVQLFTRFETLSLVHIVSRSHEDEFQQLENQMRP